MAGDGSGAMCARLHLLLLLSLFVKALIKLIGGDIRKGRPRTFSAIGGGTHGGVQVSAESHFGVIPAGGQLIKPAIEIAGG